MSEPQKLDAAAKQKVEYCIPLWLRDEQIKVAISKVKGRIAPHHEMRSEPAAIVCYGPSLAQTWEQVRGFKHVFSCSGAHRFLLDRGIVPTWHVEVDPRRHKIDLLGSPDPRVTYLPSSTCHPDYLDHLLVSGVPVTLWHVFDAEEDALRTLPHGEWALTGGCSVGLRCLTIARFLGFTDLHVFGMDGSEGETGKHAAAHPNQQKNHAITTVNGREFRTTPSFLEAARGTWHELNQMPDVRATFYGDGLVQEMAKNYVRQPSKGKALIGYQREILISESYREMNAKLHRDRLDYGVGGGRHAKTVQKLIASLITKENPFPSVLDYGCGKGYLAKELSHPIWEYDPAIPGKSDSPRPADLVVSTDVLEHIEPDRIDSVLFDLQRCVKTIGYFVIHTGPSSKILSDGRNSHLIQQPASWWQEKLSQFFVVGKLIETPPLVHVVVAPRKKKSQKAIA